MSEYVSTPLKCYILIQNCCCITLQVSHNLEWKILCQKWTVKLIFQGAYRLAGTGIVECLEIIDVGCIYETVWWLDLTDPDTPDFTTDLRHCLTLPKYYLYFYEIVGNYSSVIKQICGGVVAPVYGLRLWMSSVSPGTVAINTCAFMRWKTQAGLKGCMAALGKSRSLTVRNLRYRPRVNNNGSSIRKARCPPFDRDLWSFCLKIACQLHASVWEVLPQVSMTCRSAGRVGPNGTSGWTDGRTDCIISVR